MAMTIDIENRYYCNSCKEYFKKKDIKNIYSQDFSQKRSVCPHCESNLIPLCPICHKGKMLKTLVYVGGDYNKDGFIEPFCNICGAGFIKIYINHNLRKIYISKKDIKKTTDKIFTINNLPYENKKEVEEKIFTECKTKKQIIDLFIQKFDINKDFIEKEITGIYVNF